MKERLEKPYVVARYEGKPVKFPLGTKFGAAICAWAGCEEQHPIPKGSDSIDSLPEGWRLLVVAKGSLFDRKNLMNADVDGSLCPKHYKELLSLLKIG